MASKRVRAGKTYTYNPVGMDLWSPSCDAIEGQEVVVVNLPYSPKANTMGNCHINDTDGNLLGMCLTNSLE